MFNYLSFKDYCGTISFKYFSLIIPILSIMALLLTSSASAQGIPDFTRPDENGNFFGNELANLEAITLKTKWVDPKNPNVGVQVDINYPTNTGNNDLDQYFKSLLDKEYTDMIEKVNSEDEICNNSSCLTYFSRKFEAYSPSPDIISIVYLNYMVPQGTHRATTFVESATYDLKSGRELTLDDVFTDSKKSIPLLWPMIAKGWCDHESNDKAIIPAYYDIPEGSNDCANTDAIPLPDKLKSPPYTFKNLGFAYLTPRGISLKLIRPDALIPTTAIDGLQIDLERLLEIGAKPEIWTNQALAQQVSAKNQLPEATNNFGLVGIQNIGNDSTKNNDGSHTYLYYFILDLKHLKDANFIKLSNITINTDKGKIAFISSLNKYNLPEYILTSLKSPKLISEININDAIANIDDNYYSINNFISIDPYNQKTIEIVISKDLGQENKTCSTKTLDIGTLEGIYLRKLPAETELVEVRVDDNDLQLSYDYGLSYFFDEEANAGKRIKFHFKNFQMPSEQDGSQFCKEVRLITDLLPVD